MEQYINGNGIRYDVFWKSGVDGWFVKIHHKNGLAETYKFQSRPEAIQFIGMDCVRYN